MSASSTSIWANRWLNRKEEILQIWRKQLQTASDLGLLTLCIYKYSYFITPSPIHRGTGYCFQLISLFISFFLSFFVSKITRKWLDRFAWNFQGRCGVTMGRPDYIFGQFRETARCRDAQHGDGVCCAFAPQLVFTIISSDFILYPVLYAIAMG